MTFSRNLSDRWRCWWRGPLSEPCECEAMSAACVQAVHVLDLYRDANRRLTSERDRAVGDLRDVLDLRASNYPQRLIEGNE